MAPPVPLAPVGASLPPYAQPPTAPGSAQPPVAADPLSPPAVPGPPAYVPPGAAPGLTPPAAPYGLPPASTIPAKKFNLLGLISLIAAAVGFILVCIPPIAVIGWILLPIALIVAVVSLFMKGQGKGLGIAGLILSVVGMIAGALVGIIMLVLAAGNSAFDTTADPSPVIQPIAEEPEEDAPERDADVTATGAEGTETNPIPLGETYVGDDWEVTINAIQLDAGASIANENQFNDDAPSGTEYALVDVTLTYVGDDEAGVLPVMVGFTYLTLAREELDRAFVVAPGGMDSLTELTTGNTVSGNIVLTIPPADGTDGLISVRPGITIERVYFSLE